jgi:N-acetylmuramic acid 6-phosphate etherase
MPDYKAAARDFIENETQFHLGKIPTEQSNPLTRGLSSIIKKDTKAGVKTILAADKYIPEVSRACFKGEEFKRLVGEILRCMEEDRKVVFSSVGASGRMALQLDSTWRLFWHDMINKLPLRAEEFTRLAEVTNSFMTGGDRACVRSVENFEDYMTFGARQTVDSGVTPGDVLVVLAECGLSSSTVGSAIQGDELGVSTYYFYCNPRDVLCEHLERARKVFARTGIHFVPLFAGNMAVAGSTRMQVTTIELLVAGAALEVAAWQWLNRHLDVDEVAAIGLTALDPAQYSDEFEKLVAQLGSGEALEGMAKAVEYETDTYTAGGLITYITHAYLQDILTDTTERQPTFTLPPFRRTDDHTSPISWAYAKDPLYPSSIAWQHIIRRPIKGLDWTKEDYIKMGAAQNILDNPPKVGSEELSYYDLGWSDDESRYSRHPARLVLVDTDGLSACKGCLNWFNSNKGKFDGALTLRLGDIPEGSLSENEIRVPLKLPHTLMELMTHVAVKLAFNLLSTATMAKMGRVWSNWMIQVLPTNKKLIDRSTRIIAELAHIPYEQACEEFFKSYLSRPEGQEYRESYVVETLRRLGVDPDKD